MITSIDLIDPVEYQRVHMSELLYTPSNLLFRYQKQWNYTERNPAYFCDSGHTVRCREHLSSKTVRLQSTPPVRELANVPTRTDLVLLTSLHRKDPDSTSEYLLMIKVLLLGCGKVDLSAALGPDQHLDLLNHTRNGNRAPRKSDKNISHIPSLSEELRHSHARSRM